MTETKIPFSVTQLKSFLGLEYWSARIYIHVLANTIFINKMDLITTHRELAVMYGEPQKTVVDAIKELEDNGILMVRRHGNKPIKLTPTF